MRLEYFQLIDRIEAIDSAAGTIAARSRVPQQSSVFDGHFPGYPVLPGVLLVECMAQTAGYLVLARENFQRMPFLAQIESAKLRQFVEPGATLSIEARLEHLGSGYAVTKARVKSESAALAEAEIRFRCLPFPSPAMREQLLAHARGLGLDVPMRA
jgi:3-hydroxyacyl-[acyl-carrier-protein] dehydratase